MLIDLQGKDVFTSAEAAKVLGISDGMVRRYCRNKALKGFKKGNTWLISAYDLKHFKPHSKGRPTL